MKIAVPRELESIPGVQVTRDDVPVERGDWNQKVPVDPGKHRVVVRAPGKKTWDRTAIAAERAELDLDVPALEAVSDPPPTGLGPARATMEWSPPAPSAESSESRQRVAAVAMGATGAAGIVIGSVLGAMAKSQWSDALTHCQGNDKTKCDATGIELGGGASRKATGATISFVASGASLLAGGILWLTAPFRKPSQVQVLPEPSARASSCRSPSQQS